MRAISAKGVLGTRDWMTVMLNFLSFRGGNDVKDTG
jgi:hypothetical protein